ncbi:MAG: hypothetical protein ACO1RX_09235 [Candidatus Sericytochromatia bacterium]
MDTNPISPPPFQLEDESPLGYFSKLTEFIYTPHYARYLRRIAQRYERAALPSDLDLMPFFIDALIFETWIDGQTPLQRFIATYREQMPKAQLAVYQGFQHHLFGAYRIVSHQLPDQVTLQDLLDGSTVTLRDSEARRYLFPGLHAVVRLLPFEDHYVPTGACALLNYPNPEDVLRTARLLKPAPLQVKSDG